MGRTVLMGILALDLLVMASSAYVLWDRVSRNFHSEPQVVVGSPVPASHLPEPSAPVREPAPIVSASEPQSADADKKNAEPEAVNKQVPGKKQKTLFSFRDPYAKKVSVSGSFNQWKPQAMKKDASGKWSAALSLAPGSHAYHFIVDGKTIRDPSRSESKKVAGQKVAASVVTVKNKP